GAPAQPGFAALRGTDLPARKTVGQGARVSGRLPALGRGRGNVAGARGAGRGGGRRRGGGAPFPRGRPGTGAALSGRVCGEPALPHGPARGDLVGRFYNPALVVERTGN